MQHVRCHVQRLISDVLQRELNKSGTMAVSGMDAGNSKFHLGNLFVLEWKA